jgi:hypothetical protein
MNDLPVMTVLKCEANLSKPIEYLIFTETLPLCGFLSSFLIKITSINVFHDDAQSALLSLIDFFEGHDIWMATEDLKNLSLF